MFLDGLGFFSYVLAFVHFVRPRIPGRGNNQPCFPELESRSQKSQARDRFNTLLKAHSILSNPFLPWSIEGRRKLSSITVIAISFFLEYSFRKVWAYKISPLRAFFRRSL
jgi:hypothetical protein